MCDSKFKSHILNLNIVNKSLFILFSGETTKNQSKHIQSGMFDELTENGVEQCTVLGKHLKLIGEEFDKIITSDMTRAAQSGNIIAQQLTTNVDIVSTPEIRERVNFYLIV